MLNRETILNLAKEHVLISKGKRYQLEIFIDVYKKDVRKHIAAELKKIGAEKLHIVEEDFYVYGFFTFKERIKIQTLLFHSWINYI